MSRAVIGTRWKVCFGTGVALLLGSAALLSAGVARAGIVERVVAIVGERAVLQSELEERARPTILRYCGNQPPGPERTACAAMAKKQQLDRMVDEELMVEAGRKAGLEVTEEELDRAMDNVAKQSRATVAKVLADLKKVGVSERSYREELRRQVLELKLINVRLRNQVRVTDEDTRAAYRAVLVAERRRLTHQLAWIQLALPADRVGRERTFALADTLAARARRGEDFGALARAHSVERQTAKNGGLLPRVPAGQLTPAVAQVALGLDVGAVSAPFRFGNRVIVLKLVARDPSKVPSLAAARGKLQQRVYLEKLTRAQRRWLDGLRRATNVEVRL